MFYSTVFRKYLCSNAARFVGAKNIPIRESVSYATAVKSYDSIEQEECYDVDVYDDIARSVSNLNIVSDKNEINMLGRVLGRVFFNTFRSGGEWARLDVNTLSKYPAFEEDHAKDDRKTIRQSTHRVFVTLPSLLSMLRDGQIKHGSRLNINGELRYWKRVINTVDGEIIVPSPFIRATEIDLIKRGPPFQARMSDI